MTEKAVVERQNEVSIIEAACKMVDRKIRHRILKACATTLPLRQTVVLNNEPETLSCDILRVHSDQKGVLPLSVL